MSRGSIKSNSTNIFSRSAVILEEKSDTFSLKQGVAQSCSWSHIILFSIFINDPMIEVEKAGLGVQLTVRVLEACLCR